MENNTLTQLVAGVYPVKHGKLPMPELTDNGESKKDGNSGGENG
jgi:hypothetical protein